MQNMVSKLYTIFNFEEENETQYDSYLKYILQIIIGKNLESSLKLFKNEGKLLLCKFIELIYYLFEKKKEKREKIYNSKIDMTYGEPLDKLKKEILNAQQIPFKFKNDNYQDLYKSIRLNY